MFVRTRRLTLRPGWREDAPALAAAIAHETVVRMLSRAPWPYRLDDAEAFLALPSRIDEPTFLIFEHVGGDAVLVGGIGIHRDEAGEREVGYWLTPAAWGRGLMTEAAGAVVTTLAESLRLTRLVSGHYLDNPASGRVLTKLGFVATGEVRTRQSVARGAEVGCVMMEWRAAAAEAPAIAA
ncbi:GNAT family N-acetyltransferase [Sphingomonas yantingensis]|uniref:RimJ/RimL family protein N-acetyltransferase n=1 Tax=Sphingomonas yantingensis TaxID=1241761 RepID=A0A7W9EHW1_9SPHN|nr:GNAT family N-acetyltransferase [Sphingomonas yantingensis]MBB5697335.1 RimJ/RimL family protein N-acetyltransferase [Sphingomonas yantingensis]